MKITITLKSENKESIIEKSASFEVQDHTCLFDDGGSAFRETVQQASEMTRAMFDAMLSQTPMDYLKS